MNFTTKALAAAVALAASSSAFAAFQTTSSGNSSMVLAVWDDVAQVSYVRDLGINYNDFAPGTAATLAGFESAGSALFASTFAGSDIANIRWGVVGGERSGQANLAITRKSSETASGASNLGIANAGASIDAVLNFANTNNLLAGGTSYATDSSSFNTGGSVNKGRLLFGAAFAGTWFGNIDDTLNFFNYRGAASPALPGTVQAYPLPFTLSADGTLNYVPVPAAVWLLGSALAGVAGVARRRA